MVSDRPRATAATAEHPAAVAALAARRPHSAAAAIRELVAPAASMSSNQQEANLRTATVHIPLVDGIYPGPTRCYALSPPLADPDGPGSITHVAICVQPGRANHQLPELLVFAADSQTGGPRGSMRKLPGSGPLYFWPDDPDDGWRYGLLALGVDAVKE